MIRIRNIVFEKFSNRPELSIWFRWKNTMLVFGYMNYVERFEFIGTPSEYTAHRYNRKGWYYKLNKNYFNLAGSWRQLDSKSKQRMDLIILGKFSIRVI